ncbi:MAG: hypothetical protein SNG45_06640 [Rikenellaceae bacterium]
MKNFFKLFAIFACSVLVLGGCSKDEDVITADPIDPDVETSTLVTNVVISGSETISLYGRETYKATLTGSDYDSIEWSLSGSATFEDDEDIYDKSVVVRGGLTEGETATLKVTVVVDEDTTLTATLKLTVTEFSIPVTGISLTTDYSGTTVADNLTIYVGDEITLYPQFTPVTTTNKGYKWTITGNDAGCLSYTELVDSENFTFTGAVAGSNIVITVTADDTSSGKTFTASCNVTVANIEVTNVELYYNTDATSASTAMTKDVALYTTFTLSSIVTPAEPTSATLSWSVESATNSVAMLTSTEESAVFTAIADGTAIITLTAKDNTNGNVFTATFTATISSEITATPEVNDYYYADGTYAATPSAGGTVVGIVYKVDAATKNASVIHINSPGSAMVWATSSYSSYLETCSSTTSGTANMVAVQAVDSSFTNYPAFAYAYGLNSSAVTYTDGMKDVWYLPANEQVAEMCVWMSSVCSYTTDDTALNAMFTAGGGVSAKTFLIGDGALQGMIRVWSSTDSGAVNTSGDALVTVYSASTAEAAYSSATMKKTNSTQGYSVPILDFEY